MIDIANGCVKHHYFLICTQGKSEGLGKKEKMNIFEKYPMSRFLRGLPENSELSPLRERISDLFWFLDGLQDPHFEQQLDQDPHARLWEMMLAKILKSEGYKPKSTNRGPDFVIEKQGKKIFIEAICPGPGAECNLIRFRQLNMDRV